MVGRQAGERNLICDEHWTLINKCGFAADLPHAVISTQKQSSLQIK